MKPKHISLFLPVLILFHIIGLVLFLMPDRVEGLSGLNMLLCSTLVFLASDTYRKEAALLSFIFISGFFVEYIGVNTGLFFGTYEYGQELGWTIGGVPYVLGLNWYCIVAASAHLVWKFLPKQPLFVQALLTALACTAMDFLIEPVAMHYDFWNWEGGNIPLNNYICWFIFSAIFASVYLKFSTKLNTTAIHLYGIWFTFFLILNIFMN